MLGKGLGARDGTSLGLCYSSMRDQCDCTGFQIWTLDSLRGSRMGVDRTNNSVGQTAVLRIGTVVSGPFITAQVK